MHTQVSRVCNTGTVSLPRQLQSQFSILNEFILCWLHFAWVVDDAKCIVVTRVCVSVCLSAAVRPHYCTDPDVTWGRGRGCPLVVHYWADLQSVHRLRCCGNNANPSLRGVRARSWLVTSRWQRRSQHCAPYIASGRGWLAGDWPSTAGVLNITAAAWTAGFQW